MNIQSIDRSTSNAPVIALHSSASTGRQWLSLIEAMDPAFNVSAPDLPGYSATGLKPDYTQKGVAITAIPIIREIEKFSSQVHIVGHSHGAGVALKIALMRPDLVKSLSLYEPAAFHFLKDGTPEEKKHFSTIRQVHGQLTAAVASERPDQGMAQFINFWNEPEAWNAMSPDIRKLLTGQANAVMADFANGFTETWTLQDLTKLNIPTLMMVGMSSPEIAQYVATRIARTIPNTRLAMLPGLGHMAPVFQPHWVNPRIHEHIASVQFPRTPCVWPHRTAA